MAQFGANHPCFQPEGGAGIVIGRLVSANLTVNLATGEQYADDSLAEFLSEFSSGSIAMETDDITDDIASIIYGAKVNNGVVTYNKNDNAPRGCLAYYKALMRHGKRSFKGYYYPQVSAVLGNDNAQTRGSSITFNAVSTTFTVFADENGAWRFTKEFSEEASCRAWVEQMTHVEEFFSVTVTVQGAEAGQGVDFQGTMMYAKGSDFVLGIEGHAQVTAAYDNGVDVTALITSGSGTYTVFDISKNHTVAIIF